MKKITLEDTSYWPGYVDALVNVVLNILFLVGVMAVGLVSLNIEALNSFKSAKQAQQLQQMSEENLLLASLGTLLAVLPLPEPTPAPLMLAAAPTVPVPEPVKPMEAPLPPVQPIVPAVLNVGEPFSMATVAQEQSFLQGKVAQITNSAAQAVVYEFDALQYQLSTAQNAALRQNHANAAPDSRWLLLVSVPDAQERAAREAFWRMSSARQLLIQLGVAGESITMRTVTQDGVNYSNGRRIFLYPQGR